MSENIQSISQGTYTIGQTSATNFVAGPGIKIDEPSAGTVRIGNDETVLWSGDANTGSITASEELSNFNKIEATFSLKTQGNEAQTIVYVPGTSPGINAMLPKGANGYSYVTTWNVSNNIISLNKTYIQEVDHNNNYNEVFLTKIVGINRINA